MAETDGTDTVSGDCHMQSNDQPIEKLKSEPVECRDQGRRPSEIAREKFGCKYGWIRHEKADGRAAQRRRSRANFDADVRCSVCQTWVKVSTSVQIGARRFCANCQ
jgi:hypothetical protein